MRRLVIELTTAEVSDWKRKAVPFQDAAEVESHLVGGSSKLEFPLRSHS